MSQIGPEPTPAKPARRRAPLSGKAPTPVRPEAKSWSDGRGFERLVRSPSMVITPLGRKQMSMKLATDRVRARPAMSSSLAMNAGIGAIGLGLWGALAPGSVVRTFGLTAGPGAVRTLFGARELVTGFGVAGDPTDARLLWSRVAGDVLDIAVLRGANNPANPKARNARLALAGVLAITVVDVLTAWRQSTVRRNCA